MEKSNALIIKEKDEEKKQSEQIANGIVFVDDFNRKNLAPNWIADSAYSIIDGEFITTSKSDEWNKIAVNNDVKNTSEAEIVYGKKTDNLGSSGSGFALMLSANSVDAHGYLVGKNPKGYIRLWTINNGKPDKFVMMKRVEKKRIQSNKGIFPKLTENIFSSP